MTADELDLDAYRQRIGLLTAASPSLTLLNEIVARHAAVIPFENLDIVLGRPICLDLGSIQAKLVGSRRGGYCFEQNTLLRAALEGMGFAVRSLMARVVRGATPGTMTPRTHMLLRVDLPEGPFLADVGYGNLTPTSPIALASGNTQTTRHENYRIQADSQEHLLQVRLGTEWEDVYRFLDLPSFPIDHEVANWFTSTRPSALFTANVIAARPDDGSRITLFNAIVTTRYSNGQTQSEPVTTEAFLRQTLREGFGIELDPEEMSIIYAAIRRFAERSGRSFGLD